MHIGAPVLMVDVGNPKQRYYAVGLLSEIIDDSEGIIRVSDLIALNKEIMELSNRCNYGNEIYDN